MPLHSCVRRCPPLLILLQELALAVAVAAVLLVLARHRHTAAPIAAVLAAAAVGQVRLLCQLALGYPPELAAAAATGQCGCQFRRLRRNRSSALEGGPIRRILSCCGHLLQANPLQLQL